MGTRQIEEIFPRSSKDHPHAYGDKLSITWCSLAVIGSSPRVWGQVIMESVKKTYTGIIPTRMGTSLPPYGLCRSFRDHPHAYGDKIQITLVCQRVVKSSPRVWGQDILPYEKAWNMRIIPTRMGTSDPMFFFNFRLRDHPHAYGDKKLSYTQLRAHESKTQRVCRQVM